MEEIVLFPDAVALVIEYLNASLVAYGETAPVHKNVPNPRPAKFVQVFRTGGPRSNLVVDGAQLTISVWADTDAAASDLAEVVRAVLNAVRSQIIGQSVFYKVNELGGPVDLPDPQSNQSRMTWSVIALLRSNIDLPPS